MTVQSTSLPNNIACADTIFELAPAVSSWSYLGNMPGTCYLVPRSCHAGNPMAGCSPFLKSLPTTKSARTTN